MKVKILLLSLVILAFMATALTTQSLGTPYIKEGLMNGVSYAAGGVGVEERKIMEKMAHRFNLKLVFAVNKGDYLASVSVAIAKPTGEVLVNTVADGPWLLADLPNGTYEVTARCRHDKKVRQVKVNGGLRTVMFHWSQD